MLAVKSATSPPVGCKLLLRDGEGMQAVEIIEQLKLSFAPQVACHTEQAVGLYPEIIGGKIVDWRIYK